MEIPLKRILLIFLTLAFCLILGGAWLLHGLNEKSAIRATLEWSRLGPFPVPKSELKIETFGSSFTREFRIEFTAEPKTIQTWLDASPGTKGLAPELQSDGWWLYKIKPSGGAAFAELRLSPDKTEVRIKAYWS